MTVRTNGSIGPTVPSGAHSTRPVTKIDRTSALCGLLQRKQTWTLTVRGWLALLAVGAALILAFVSTIHPFLAVTNPTQADVLVVEGWIPNYALEESIAEFNSKPYRLMFTVGCDILNGVNVEDGDNHAVYAAKRLKWLGMKPELVQPVVAHTKYRNRTYQSAIALSKWIEEHHMSVTSFEVVSVGAHARRSRLLFEKAFKSRARVGIIAVEDREYDPKQWWRYSEGVKEVVSESAAYLYARLVFQPSE